MLRSKDFNSDAKELEVKLLKVEKKPKEVTLADVLKVQLLMAKLIRDMRTNQVSWMKKEYGDDVFVKTRRPVGKSTGKDGKVETKKDIKKDTK